MNLIATASPNGRPGYSQTMPCTAQSAGEARALVRDALSVWAIDDLADAGALLVSELVSNSVRHTRCRDVRVTVTRTGQDAVRIAVVDKSRVLPVRREPDDEDPHGRGLVIVETLTARWGADLLPWGKRVWCELDRENTR